VVNIARSRMVAMIVLVIFVAMIFDNAGACTLLSTAPTSSPCTATAGLCNSYANHFWNLGTYTWSQPLDILLGSTTVTTCSTGFTVIIAQFHNFGTQSYQLNFVTSNGFTQATNTMYSSAGSCLDISNAFLGQTSIISFTMQGFPAATT